jgi:hypothetical protein
MHNKVKDILLKKNNGSGELICGLVALMALVIMLFLSVFIAQDISKIQTIDQIARQAIIKVETSGSLTETQINAIKQSLENSGAFFDTPAENDTGTPDGVYLVYKDGGKWVIDLNNKYIASYGEEIGIYIQCEIYTTNFNGKFLSGESVFYGNNKLQVIRQKYSITKATSTKY